MRETHTIPEWFAKKDYKRGQDVIEYLCDQYYIYGPQRSDMMTWTSAIRASVGRDALHFEEYYENEKARRWYDKHNRNVWHNTDRTLSLIFDDISEISCYQLDERNEDVYKEFLQAIYESWKRAKKQNFKNKLNNKDEFVW